MFARSLAVVGLLVPLAHPAEPDPDLRVYEKLLQDAGVIDARRRYTVQATITIDGQVAFRTTTAHPVLTNGAPSAGVEVVVQPVR